MIMNKFKVGDRVKCVDVVGSYGLTLYNVYTVLDLDDELTIIDDNGELGCYLKSRFELAESEKEQSPPQFKVGDKVKCVREYKEWLTPGGKYIASEVYHNGNVGVIGDCGISGSFSPSYFELAESEPEQPTSERAMLIYNYLDAQAAFERASTAYNEACQAIRDNLKDGEKFVYTRYAEGYIVQRDKDGFTVERIDIV
jgi:hypothetical protein